MTQSEKGEVLAAARPPGGSAMHDNDNSPRGHTEDRKVGLRPGFFSVAPPTGPSSYSETTNEPDLPTLACFFLFFLIGTGRVFQSQADPKRSHSLLLWRGISMYI